MNEAVASELRVKAAELLRRREDLKAEIAQVDGDLARCVSVAKLFGFDLELANFNVTIKQKIQAKLDEAGKAGVRVSALRGLLGTGVHPKTIGMTLYRLKEKGEAERRGWTWYTTKSSTEGPGL